MNRRSWAVAAVAALTLSACSAQVTTPVPTWTPTPLPTDAGNPSASCANPTQTFARMESLPKPGAMPKGILSALSERGRVRVGFVIDQLPLGGRNARTGEVEGFETDLHRYLTKALVGDAGQAEIQVVTPADALELLADHSIDIAVAGMPVTCGRWGVVSFTAPYLTVEQRLLLPDAADAKAGVAGKKVCIVAGSPYGANLTGATVVPGHSATDCLVRLQRGEVDAVSDTTPVLEGLRAQDPFTAVTETPLGSWSYAVGVAKDRPQLAQFMTAALQQWVAEGGWAASHDRWIKPVAGDSQPPVPQYGRPS